MKFNHGQRINKAQITPQDDGEEDTLKEGEEKAGELNTAKAEADVNAKVRAAAEKKAFEEAEFKRKFNDFDGLLHGDDGQRYFPDGEQVRSVNNNLGMKKHHHHKHHSTVQTHVRKDDEDNLKEAEDRANELNAAN